MTATTPVTTRIATRAGSVLVVGVGSPDRGDDAIGPAVALALTGRVGPGVELRVHEDPTDLVSLWAGHDLAVVVDAVCAGDPPGRVTLHEAGAASGARLPVGRLSSVGTHSFGVAEAVELARALGTLPTRLYAVGVQAAGFAHGAPLSQAVAAAVPEAAALVLDLLDLPDGTAVSPNAREADHHVPR